VMVGEGDTPDERFALESLVRSMGLADSVTFTGFVPIEQAWDLAASASVCLSPFYPTKILASTSPTKLIEYMALGRPVVCNDHPEQSAIIRDSGAGICTLWGAEHFAEAIVSLLDYPEQAEAMAARGPGWVSAHRTYTVIARKVHARYREIVGARG
jgi:glycosyltransferase involved in cell wall biosynthesis